ncbi:MAG: type II toxin-antitoxin system RelE/ParE family toxin [Candidatus Acidiferrales bacterium]
MVMAWDIETTDEFQGWWAELSEAEHEAITIGVTVLEEKGPALGRPHDDTLARDSKHPNMKEMRVQFAGKPYRICFASDPRQTGNVLIGGIKSGKTGQRK